MNKMEFTKRKLGKCYHFMMLFLLTLLTISGCSLAVEDGEGEQSKDILLGVMLTRDYIEKTYADVVWGEKGIESISFRDLSGPYALGNIWNHKEYGPTYGTTASEGIDYSNHISVIDSENIYELNINVNLLKKKDTEEQIFYMNPIYMTSDGKIYTVAGNRASFSSFDENGESIGYTLNEKETFHWNDTKLETTIKINIDASLADETNKISFTQIDANHKAIRNDEFEPGQVLDKLFAEKGTEYILITTWQNGEVEIDREVCSWDGETTYEPEAGENQNTKGQKATLCYTLYPDESGFLLKQNTWVVWPE